MQSRSIPPPYAMCRREECDARQSSGEVSIFERAPHVSSFVGPLHSKPSSSSLQAALQKSAPGESHKRITKSQYEIDPSLAVSKYRRSAAGVTDRYPPRAMDQLIATVQYLQDLLIQAPPLSPDGVTVIETYLSVVEFVQDRFRAVQVDLTRSQQASKQIQLSIIRTQILILYLMADVPEYSTKLGKDALKAALSNYWMDTNNTTEMHQDWDDEVLSYTLILQVCCEEHVSFLEHCRKYPPKQGKLLNWSLRIAGEWAQGNWYIVLRTLQQGSCNVEFSILARCCLAAHLNYVRRKALEMYNVTWGKAEAVAVDDLKRLLFTENVTSFCQACGLPLNDRRDSVVFKFSQLEQQQKLSSLREDTFVFGSSCGSFRSVPLGKLSMKLPSVKCMATLCYL